MANWQERLANHDQATFFHTPSWYHVWESYKGYQPHAALLTVNGKEVLFPYASIRFKKGLFKKIISSPAGVYGGFLTKEPLTADELDALLKAVTQMGQEVVVTDVANKMGKRSKTTQVIDLSAGMDKVREGYAEAHQRKIRNTTKDGVIVRLANSVADWDAYVGLYNNMLNNWQNPTMRYSKSLFDELQRHEGIQLWLTEKDGEILSGAICVYYGKHAAYWHGASNQTAREFNANYLLFDTLFEDAAAKGFRVFDLMPSPGLKGVEEFKSNFGAVKKEVSLIVRTSKILKIFGHA